MIYVLIICVYFSDTDSVEVDESLFQDMDDFDLDDDENAG